MDVKARHVFVFKRNRIYRGIFGCIALFALGFWLVADAELSGRNDPTIILLFRLLGTIGCLYYLMLLYATVSLLFRSREALVVGEDCIIDRSRFESIGKIGFKEIKEVHKYDKEYIELVIHSSIFRTRDISLFKKMLLLAHSFKPSTTVNISCVFLSCDAETLYSSLKEAYEDYCKKSGISDQNVFG